jgi:hypothetical protein
MVLIDRGFSPPKYLAALSSVIRTISNSPFLLFVDSYSYLRKGEDNFIKLYS